MPLVYARRREIALLIRQHNIRITLVCDKEKKAFLIRLHVARMTGAYDGRRETAFFKRAAPSQKNQKMLKGGKVYFRIGSTVP